MNVTTIAIAVSVIQTSSPIQNFFFCKTGLEDVKAVSKLVRFCLFVCLRHTFV